MINYFIPARGGSKGIPKKNLQQVNNRTLVQLAFDHAKQLLPGNIILSSDSPEILNSIDTHPSLTKHHRPSHLATDSSTVLDLLLDYFASSDPEDIVCLLEPTCPFRDPNITLRLLHSVLSGDYQSSTSLCRLDHPIERIWSFTNGRLAPLGGDKCWLPRQNLTHGYFLDGQAYVLTVSHLITARCFVDDQTFLFDHPNRLSSIDIDDPFDLLLAQALASLHR